MSTFDYKKLTGEELEEIFVDFPFQIPPMRHQMISMAFASSHDRIMLLHGVGTGKTLTSIWTAQLWESKKILVVCPSSAFSAWERDLSLYTNYSFDFLVGSGKDRKAKLKKKKDIYIVNYEGLKTIFCNLMKGKGWKINYQTFIYNFGLLILDEVHKCQSYKSLQSKICLQLSKMAKNVVGLTGTAVDSSLLEVFNIYKVVDLGRALGDNFFFYRMNYFKPGMFEWTLKPGSEKKIMDQMSRSTLSFERKECFDLPELQEVVRTIEPSKEFLDLQHRIIMEEKLKIGNSITIDLGSRGDDSAEGLSKQKIRSHLLRELPGGFLYYKGEDGVRRAYHLKKNAKLEALLDLLDDTTDKIIIFYLYTEEGDMIQSALTANKHKYISIRGGQKIGERTGQVKKFQTDKSIKYAVVQQSAGAEGWDGSVASIVVYFDGIGSPKKRKQCSGRMHRKGQTKPCLVIDLVLKHSIDSRVIKNRSERFNFVKEVMDYIQEYGGVEQYNN